MARNAALTKLSNRSSDATKSGDKYRDAAATREEARKICMKSYREGEAIAYSDAYGIMQAELERLRNLWQNGSLTYSDFTGI